MKKLLSASIAAATIAGFAAPAAAIEGLSANAGLVSDYYFRGSNLGDAGAYAGVDYEVAGFYVGVWAIDDGSSAAGGNGNDGLEYDVYLGYGLDLGEDYSLNFGLTSYQYTYGSNFENEVNIGASFPMGFGVDIAYGNADDGADADADYSNIELSWGGEVFGATLGRNASEESNDDSQSVYAELSASGEVATLDMGVTLGRVVASDDAAGDDVGSSDYYIFLDISKSFDL